MAETASPSTVGNFFVEQYFNCLVKCPDKVHKFYMDTSVISRPNSDGLVSSATSLTGIDELIRSQDYENLKFEILTADSQQSLSDSVVVLVTGLVIGNDNIERPFTQVFFLAEQESEKYYVMNDVFRYVDNYSAPSIAVNSGPEPSPLADNSVMDHASTPVVQSANQDKEVYHALENGSASSLEKEVVNEVPIVAAQDEPKPVAAATIQKDAPVNEAPASTIQEAGPKKSYASIANALNFKKEPFAQRVSPAKPVQQPHASVAPAPEAVPHPKSNNAPEKSNSIPEKSNNQAVKGYSIFVASLPMDATVEQLEEAFKKFGPIKHGGIQVRSYQRERNCFGFVEFETADAMQKAVEASTIRIGNRKAHIEEKKANGDGGNFPTRRGGFNNGNFRGRGNFGGGRGYGRNEADNHEGNRRFYQNGGGRASRQSQPQPRGDNNLAPI